MAIKPSILKNLVEIRRDKGWGTGFVLTSPLILTCHHVVPNDKKDFSATHMGREYRSQLVYTSKKWDFSLIQVEDDLDCIGISTGDSSSVQPEVSDYYAITTKDIIQVYPRLNHREYSSKLENESIIFYGPTGVFSPGVSGTPIVDGEGSLVSILWGVGEGKGPQGVDRLFTIPINSVVNHLLENGGNII